jgi:thioesterase domain-containing protein/acyl carrier protein
MVTVLAWVRLDCQTSPGTESSSWCRARRLQRFTLGFLPTHLRLVVVWAFSLDLARTVELVMGNPAQEPAALCGSIADDVVVRRADLGLPAPWQEPQSDIERRLAQTWQQVLRIDAVSRLDDFFDLGGDSLAATTLAAEIEATFGVRFAPGDIINASTVVKQAATVTNRPALITPQLPPYVVVGRATGAKPPLFMVHGAGGFSFFKQDFFDAVGRDRPIYLFEAPGLNGRTEPLETVEEIARAYITSMRTIQPAGPYHLGAMCAGSFIALEMCNQLVDNEESVAGLVLLDPSPAPRALAKLYPNRDKWGQRFQAKQGLSWSQYLFRRFLWAWNGKPDPFEEELKTRAKMLKRKTRIRKRLQGEQSSAPPQEQSYSADKMLLASQQLYRALNSYVPRPYAGRAAILVRAQRPLNEIAGKRAFWRNYLGEIDCRHSEGSHQELFDVYIRDTGHFVRDVLKHSDWQSGPRA